MSSGNILEGGTSDWHVDGALKARAKLNLVYNDGGAPVNSLTAFPYDSQWNKNQTVVVGNHKGNNTAIINPARKDGFTFTGWKMYTKDNEGEYTVYRDDYATGESFTITEDTLLVAQWKKGTNILVLKKVDGLGTPLTGAKFRMTPTDGTAITVDMTSGSQWMGNYEYSTVYKVEEISTPSAVYPDSASTFYFQVRKSESGTSAKFVTDSTGEKTASQPDDVRLTVSDNGVVTITVTNYAYFYVFHSNAGQGTVSLQKVRIDGTNDDTNNDSATDQDRGQWNSDGKTYNLVDCVTKGFLYGGYYEDYGGKGSYTDTNRVLDGSVAYTGQANAWDAADAYYTEKGTAITPVAGRTYFLKEVPNEYFRAATFIVYDTRAKNKNQIKKLYLMTAADDTNYADVYFKVENTSGISDAAKVKSTIFDAAIDVVGSGVSTPVKPLTTQKVFDLKNGYLAAVNKSDYIVNQGIYTEVPYFETLDGVTVTGVQKLRVYLRDTTFYPTEVQNDPYHWTAPGITKVALNNTYSAR